MTVFICIVGGHVMLILCNGCGVQDGTLLRPLQGTPHRAAQAHRQDAACLAGLAARGTVLQPAGDALAFSHVPCPWLLCFPPFCDTLLTHDTIITGSSS